MDRLTRRCRREGFLHDSEGVVEALLIHGDGAVVDSVVVVVAVGLNNHLNLILLLLLVHGSRDIIIVVVVVIVVINAGR